MTLTCALDVRRTMAAGRGRLLALCVLALWASDAPAQTGQPEPQAQDDPAPLRHRVHVETLEAILRFNYMDVNADPPAERVATRDPQYRIRTRMQIDLAPRGTTYLKLRAETGRGFDNSWDNVGGGFSSASFHFNMKSFEIGQKLGRHVTVAIGGLEFDAGSGTETTYASGDAPFVGYRAAFQRPRGAKISVTAGAVRDFDEANFFLRTDDLGDPNYVQVLGQGELAPGLDASIEWDSIAGVRFARQAVHWRAGDGGWAMPAGLLDDVRFEFVERVTDEAMFAWSAMAGRALTASGRHRAQVIYSDIPLLLYVRNGERFFFNRGEIKQGKRLSGSLSHAVARDWELGAFVGRLLDATPTLRWTAQVYVKHDFSRALTGVLRR